MLKPICVRLPNWVGDACMSLPALHLLGNAGYPLVLVGRPWARDLLAGLEPREFVAVQGPLRRDAAHLRDVLRAARGRRGAPHSGPCKGICFPDSISSALVFRLAGIRTGGYRDDGRSLLLKWPISKPSARSHAVESYYHLARTVLQKWQVPATLPAEPGPVLHLPLTSGHRQVAQATLERYNLYRKPFVLISPTATGLHKGRIKSWPHYEPLSRHLIGQGWPVVMCPPPNEVDAARAAAPSATVLPALPLGGYAALTPHAALVICNDSGTSHIAAAVQSRQLTLFGVTNPQRTRPWSPSAAMLGEDGAWPSLEAVMDKAVSLLRQPHTDHTPQYIPG